MVCLTVAPPTVIFFVGNPTWPPTIKSLTIYQLGNLKGVRPVWQWVSTDSLKFHPGLPCPTLLRPASALPLERPYRRFWGGPSARGVVCGRLLSPWMSHAVQAWKGSKRREIKWEKMGNRPGAYRSRGERGVQYGIGKTRYTLPLYAL
jgi:hypothetical protein